MAWHVPSKIRSFEPMVEHTQNYVAYKPVFFAGTFSKKKFHNAQQKSLSTTISKTSSKCWQQCCCMAPNPCHHERLANGSKLDDLMYPHKENAPNQILLSVLQQILPLSHPKRCRDIFIFFHQTVTHASMAI